MKTTKIALLISGGIDSPVAAHLLLERGIKLVYVHFDNRPLTDEKPINKAKELIKTLNKTHNIQKSKLYLLDHGKNQIEILQKSEQRYMCILCRRMMFRIAEQIAILENCQAIATGENIGQVASQTLSNMKTITECTKIPIIRPILCNDKQETTEIAKKIKTYETSIMPGMCCTAVPKNPATKSAIEKIKKEEQKLDINKLIHESIENARIEYI